MGPIKVLLSLLLVAPTRGFSLFRQRLAAPKTKLSVVSPANVLGAIDTFWKSDPYTAAFVTCGFKASAADLVAQTKADDDNSRPISKRQNLAFFLYGALYQGVAQEFIYNHLYPRWFGVGKDVITVASKVLFDLLLQTTLITLPMAYLIKGIIFQYSAKEAMRRYKDDILNHGLLTKYATLWGPVQCLTFGVVPEHWRVTFIACISFFWLIILSSIASRRHHAPVDDESIFVDTDDEARWAEDKECLLLDGYTCEYE